jgi:hypothetical protein
MDESEIVSQENPQDRFENMSCMLSFQLSQDSDLCFDVLWNEDEDLKKLAILIHTIKNSDLIEKQIVGMDTDSPESVQLLLTYLKQLSKNNTVMKPDQVLNYEES